MNNFKRKTNFISWLTILGLIVSFIGLPTPVDATTPVYKYEWVDQSGNVSLDGLAHEYTNLQPGQTINLSLTMINRSGTTIQPRYKLPQSPDKQVPVGSWGIGTQNPQDGTPSFLDASSFFLNNNRFIYYEGEKALDPSGDAHNLSMMHFSWNIKLKNNLANGVYYLYVRPVCEYKAWTRQVKNGVTFSSGDSDIYWKFIVGGGDSSDVPAGYVRYVNPKYGFSLVYKQPVYPEIFEVDDKPNMDLYGGNAFQALLGALEGGNAFFGLSIYDRSRDINQLINQIDIEYKEAKNTFGGVGGLEFEYAKSNLQRNGINWTKFTVSGLAAGSGYTAIDLRIGTLPSGYILRVWSRRGGEEDRVALDSVKPIDNQVYVNSQFGFSIDYPLNWEAKELDANGPVSLVGFRPNTMESDYQWAINIFSVQDTTMGEVIDDFGDQFSDRVQNSNSISFNGIEATRTITTTNQWPNWYSETITFAHNGLIYNISNGAIFNDNFDDFYKSFQFI